MATIYRFIVEQKVRSTGDGRRTGEKTGETGTVLRRADRFRTGIIKLFRRYFPPPRYVGAAFSGVLREKSYIFYIKNSSRLLKYNKICDKILSELI